MNCTLSFTPRHSDTYKIALMGLKRVDVYASKIVTPQGRAEPRPGLLALADFDVRPSDPPKKLFGRKIDEDAVTFMALYHKLDPIPRKKVIILTTQRRDTALVDRAEEILSSIAPDSYYTRKHKGKKAIFITDRTLVNELITTLGDRYTKRYPPWLIGSKHEKTFIEERMSDILTHRKNSVEFTSSSVNNPVLFKMLINQGYYVNVRKIEHTSAKNRELWYFTVYPTREEHADFIARETGIRPKIRTKNIINGRPYYRIKDVNPLQ